MGTSGRCRTSLLLVAVALCLGAAATPARASQRILLDREDAEFVAEFFAITHGSNLDQDRHANCRRRIALNLRRCQVSWDGHRYSNDARLLVAAFRRRPEVNRYLVTYRLRRTDKRCASTMSLEDCTSVSRGREAYSGG